MAELKQGDQRYRERVAQMQEQQELVRPWSWLTWLGWASQSSLNQAEDSRMGQASGKDPCFQLRVGATGDL